MASPDTSAIETLAKLMRQLGIAHLELDATGAPVRLILGEPPETERMAAWERMLELSPDPDAAEADRRVLDERAKAEQEAEARREYERLAFAATEGVPR